MAESIDGEVRAAAGRKPTKCERQFLDKDGNVHARAFADVSAVQLFFVETEQKLTMPLADLPEGVFRAAAAFGLNTSVGNTFGAIADADEAFEVASSRWERLCAGEWTSERQTGPRTTDLLTAALRYQESVGKDAGEEAKAKLTAKLADPAYAKALAANPQIAVHIAAIRKERAEERARKAQEEAGENKSSPILDDLLA